MVMWSPRLLLSTPSHLSFPRMSFASCFPAASQADAAKRELLRQIYDKYEGWVKVGGPNSLTEGTNPEPREFTVSVVFVMSKETAPPEGELVGDILYVAVPEGYRNIVLKTKAMLCLVRHFDFEFLLKADDDSFVCLTRIASMLHDLDPEISGKVYAGVPTACNQSTNPDYWNGRVMKNPDHRWFDSKYVQHTLGGLDCFPAYMQGAFYILAQPLVEHLYRGHEHLECFTNEDVTIGSWLMGVDREMVEMYNLHTSHLWDCLCARTQITVKTRRKQMFFHNCKGLSQLKLCGTRLLRPGVGC
ncbi:GT31 [Ectocarpus sp. CCAP 1310/34]|nr:GT31 [Ectocarpus sp. CCAP 1310/34]